MLPGTDPRDIDIKDSSFMGLASVRGFIMSL